LDGAFESASRNLIPGHSLETKALAWVRQGTEVIPRYAKGARSA